MSKSDITRTLWSKTLYEGLYFAMEKNDAKAVMIAIADLKLKDFLMPEVLAQVRDDKGSEAEIKLKRMISKAETSKDNDKGGIFSFIKNFFN